MSTRIADIINDKLLTSLTTISGIISILVETSRWVQVLTLMKTRLSFGLILEKFSD